MLYKLNKIKWIMKYNVTISKYEKLYKFFFEKFMYFFNSIYSSFFFILNFV